VVLRDLRRTAPPWILSAALHALLAGGCVLLAPVRPPEARPATTFAAEIDPGSEFRTESREGDHAIRAPNPDLPPALQEESSPSFEETPPSREAPDSAPPDPFENPNPDLTIGFGGGGARRPGPAPVKFDANPDFGGEGADGANRNAASILLKSMGNAAGEERRLLRQLDPRRVLVVRGSYDHAEGVFNLLGLRHEILEMDEVALAPLTPGSILIVNCGNEVLSAEGARKVREFVESGGYLCTTDWGLENVLEKAFPGVLRSLYRGGAGVCTVNETVSIRVLLPEHPLLRGLRVAGRDARWWLEDRAHPIEVRDHERVQVLVDSPELKRQYGSGVVACTFNHGKGRVLHIIGHSWQKEGNLKGVFSMQRVLVNFLLERVRSLKPAEPEPVVASPDAPAAGGPR